MISLGPIQDFIASARRCQDLWFGSWLLSELSRTTAEAVADAAGADTIVFPAGIAGAGRDRPGVANKILARLPPGLDPAEVAGAARRRQQARLEEIAQTAWERIPPGAFLRETALSQVRELMEFLWVAVPEERSYSEARDIAEARLAAIKNTRPWTQPPWISSGGPTPGIEPDGGRVPKSSLDGDRESVVLEEIYNEWGIEERRRRLGVKGAERLCGIGLLKRLGSDVDQGGSRVFRGEHPSFHSTGHVAMSPLIERLRAADDAVAQYLDRLRDLGLDTDRFRVSSRPSLRGHDGGLLIQSRLTEHFSEYATRPLTAAELQEVVRAASRALADLQAEVDHRGEPCPYYAFLLADGDRMGVAIDGMSGLEAHQELGRALNSFASDCRGIVHEHRGSLIFSGGDDVLALVPLHRAVRCARALADHFAAAVQPVVDRLWVGDGERPTTTLSVGIGISHHRDPMGDARRVAQRAEKEAKVTRNALAVLVSKRSGGDLLVTGSWSDDPLDRRLTYWDAVIDAGDLSAKAAHDLQQVAAHYDPLSPDEQRARSDEIRSLVKQVLARKRAVGGGRDPAGEAVERLLEGLEPGAAGGLLPAAKVHEMATELQIARLLAHARWDSGEPPMAPDNTETT